MFKILILQALNGMSDDQAEFQIRDRLSFVRFLGLMPGDPVSDDKAIWLVREYLTHAGAVEKLFPALTSCFARMGIWRCPARHPNTVGIL